MPLLGDAAFVVSVPAESRNDGIPNSPERRCSLIVLDLRMRYGRDATGNSFLPERRCSSRTFRYGYLVTT